MTELDTFEDFSIAQFNNFISENKDLEYLERLKAKFLDILGEKEAKKAIIDSQILEAKAIRGVTGKYSDASWYRKCSDAGRITGQEAQVTQRKIGIISSRIKRLMSESYTERFVKIAKEILPAYIWQKISDEARRNF